MTPDRLIAWRPHSTNPVMAGVRYRCLNPLRHLRKQGYPVELYDPGRAERYSAVLFQALCCRADPNNPLSGGAVLEDAERLRGRGAVILTDECDNHFFNPRQDPVWEETASRIRQLIRLSHRLVASTEAVADVLRHEAGPDMPISVIGDGVETGDELAGDAGWRRLLSWRRKQAWLRLLRLRRQLHAERRRGITQLVWFGSHGSAYAEGGMLDLLKIRAPLERLSRRFPLSLTVISNNEPKYREHIAPWDIPTRYVMWDRVTFVPLLRAHDIAVIPITPNPFTLCKSNNRLAQALQEGLAVVADPIPSYLEFSEVSQLGDWEKGLVAYLESPSLRTAHVAKARHLISDRWVISRIADQWKSVFDHLSL